MYFFHFSHRDSDINEEGEFIHPVGEPYNKDATTPVFSWQARPFTWQRIVQILSREYDDEKLCVATPVNVRHNVSFLAKNSAFKDMKDLKCDDMGVWHNKGSPKLYFMAEKKESHELLNLEQVEIKPKDSVKDLHALKRTFFVNASSPDCRKVFSTLLGNYFLAPSTVFRPLLVSNFSSKS